MENSNEWWQNRSKSLVGIWVRYIRVGCQYGKGHGYAEALSRGPHLQDSSISSYDLKFGQSKGLNAITQTAVNVKQGVFTQIACRMTKTWKESGVCDVSGSSTMTNNDDRAFIMTVLPG